jgi:hypothetical protein
MPRPLFSATPDKNSNVIPCVFALFSPESAIVSWDKKRARGGDGTKARKKISGAKHGAAFCGLQLRRDLGLTPHDGLYHRKTEELSFADLFD